MLLHATFQPTAPPQPYIPHPRSLSHLNCTLHLPAHCPNSTIYPTSQVIVPPQLYTPPPCPWPHVHQTSPPTATAPFNIHPTSQPIAPPQPDVPPVTGTAVGAWRDRAALLYFQRSCFPCMPCNDFLKIESGLVLPKFTKVCPKPNLNPDWATSTGTRRDLELQMHQDQLPVTEKIWWNVSYRDSYLYILALV